MADVLYTAPASEPLTLDEAKKQLNQDHDYDDEYIASLIIAARRYCEQYQNRAYITQTRDIWLDGWPVEDYIETLPPLATVTHIKYYDTANVEYTVSSADYFVDTKSFVGRIGLAYNKSWPTLTLRPFNGINVRYTCGSTTVDEGVKLAMKLLIGHWYKNREAVGVVEGENEHAVKALLGLNRRRLV
jgi:uncharacterized phiE125 gp8 family phage protein